MKRILIPAALALALCGGLAVAQQAEARHKQHDPHKTAVKMAHKLNLTPDQTSRIEPIIAARQQKMSALRADTSLTPDARRQQFRALHQDSERQIAGILTPDQLQQLKSMHHGHGRHGQHEPPPAA
jgi:Spy/CpxP family protein refolding chaperone